MVKLLISQFSSRCSLLTNVRYCIGDTWGNKVKTDWQVHIVQSCSRYKHWLLKWLVTVLIEYWHLWMYKRNNLVFCSKNGRAKFEFFVHFNFYFQDGIWGLSGWDIFLWHTEFLREIYMSMPNVPPQKSYNWFPTQYLLCHTIFHIACTKHFI